MKKAWFILIAIICMIGSHVTQIFAQSNEMRAVWISTVYGTDFTSNKGNIQAQQQEYINKLDTIKSIGLNTVIVQVRPKADAWYSSEINPWSELITGIQGQYPGYDPMEFMIEQAHNRGLEFHAWLNPYRITTSGTDLSVLCDTHPARLYPDWVIEWNNALYYNPELPQVKEHIRDTVLEIVKNYDVDGIHFDDYFYPSDYPLPEGESPEGAVANQRREHINEMVQMVYETIKSEKPEVVFGISPMGVWKNSSSDSTGSKTNGKEAYYSVYADAKAWITNHWIDYIVPQIYWETGHKAADYETLVRWWNQQVEQSDVKLYIGQGIYKDIVASEITEQLNINKQYSNVSGSFYFSLRDLLDNRQGCSNALKSYYMEAFPVQETPVPSIPQIPVETIPPQEPAPVPSVIDKTPVPALSTDIKVFVDGEELEFENYNIHGNTYFKLRDLAQALSSTQKQFHTEWKEESKAIHIVTDTAYLSTGEELQKAEKKDKIAVASDVLVLKNGEEIQAQAYSISDYTYFKLRDLAIALDFAITWNEDNRTIGIVSFAPYEQAAG